MKILSGRMPGALALGLPVLVAAQGLPPAPAEHVHGAASSRAESAFAEYRPYRDVPTGDWKALNAAVRDRGAGTDMHDAMPMPTRPAPLPRHGDHPRSGGRP